MATEVIVTADGRELAYAQWGDPGGFPVFSLHGTPGCRLNRHPDNDAIAAAGVRLITYDRPGFGRSTRRPGRRVMDCAGDVASIADAEGIARFAVTGGSGGGPHALAVAARLPERVTRARCDSGPAPFGAEGLDWFAGMDPENVKEFGWALDGEDVLHSELSREADQMVARVGQDPSAVLGDGWDLAEADKEVLGNPIVQAVYREAVPEWFAHGVWGWADDDLALVAPWGFDLSEITVPVEIRYGAKDVLVPASHGAWLAENVPGASVAVESGQGHLASPDRVIELLRSLVPAG
ncbi:MAG: alpha/beta fold hydrolase [Micromonosporaceae bacterium]